MAEIRWTMTPEELERWHREAQERRLVTDYRHAMKGQPRGTRFNPPNWKGRKEEAS